ncbi:MAG: AMP-binding protein [Eubacteriaceae bacterium]|jgi:long-chain acyl-CoA synthetase|nr:AMP-binding protein [Eubacteriaceae bacterium]
MPKKFYKEKRFSNYREIINYSAKQYKDRAAFQIKRPDDSYCRISYRELENRYYTLCGKFLDMGFRHRRIAVVGANCFEWVLSYLCASTVGCAVPLDKELGAEDLKDFIEAAGCDAVCCADKYAAELIPVLSGEMICMSFSEIAAMSELHGSLDRAEVDNIDIPRDRMQILIFTSGTTGNSKGVCLSQYNVCSNIYSTVSSVKIKTKDITLSILPLHHTYECTLNCLLILSRGGKITYCQSLKKLPKNMAEYHPTVLVVVPALLKVLDKRIKNTIAKECPEKYRTYFENETLADALGRTPYIVRRVIRAKVRRTLGGQLRLFIVGAAELDPMLVKDFAALGIRTLQGYGLTECSPLLAGNSDFYWNAASTGVAMRGVVIKIDAPNAEGVGEIIARGDNIMLGYYKDEAANEAVFRGGWFHTGDLGCMDPEGALYIKGRIKNVIVTANGKNIYPEELETRLSQHPEIGEVLVVGSQDRNGVCVKAKILPNLDFLKEKLGHIPTAEDIQSAVQSVIRDVNDVIPSYKHIKMIEILEFALEKTTTQKIKRCGGNLL